jgi:hypothetical protein
MAKRVLSLIVGVFLLIIPVIASGSYPSFNYPNIPVFDNKNTNGAFNVYIEKDGAWESAGVLGFDSYFRQRTLDITNHAAGPSSLKIKLKKEGGGAAHIDSVLLNSTPPLKASGIGADIKKLKQDDFDVVDASGNEIVLDFPVTGGKTGLSLSARIEELEISKTPFQYPLANLYREIGQNSAFYNYRLEKGGRVAERQIFREYSLTGSGHPSGNTYCWASNDEHNLYVRIDFTPDNTMDGEKDYAKVYVKTEEGVKEFKVSVPETRWGKAAFTYTDKVSYQHKVYDFAIPLGELGITDTTKTQEIQIAFAAYGTATPIPPSFGTLYLGDPVDSLHTVNTSTAGTTLVGSGECEGLAPGSDPSFLFCVNDDATLYTITTADGIRTIVGPMGSPYGDRGLAYNRNTGILYGADDAGFGSINTSTGVFAPLATPPAPTEDMECLAADPNQNAIYGVNNLGYLLRYNVGTGTWAISESSLGFNGDDCGLAFDPNAGILYFIDGAGDLYSINPNTFAVSLIGDTGLGPDNDFGLAFVTDSSSVAIPAMSQWGIIVFMILAGFVVMYYLRRRKSREN